jgi:hypothetical protein
MRVAPLALTGTRVPWHYEEGLETFLASFPDHSAALMLPLTTLYAKDLEHEAGTRDAAKNHPRMDVAPEGQATD